MPPNKPKLYKNKNPTKLPKIPQQNLQQASTSQTSINSILPNQEQFEIELCWCIQQFQSALDSGKLNNKQVQEHTKALNVLMSNTAPMVKKRQVMRLSFGDYREKMAEQEKKISKNAANMKFKSATPNKKTVFLRKSLFSSTMENNFKFNFKLQDQNTPVTEVRNPEVPKNIESFVPSKNTFKFDFQVESENET